MWRAVVWRCSRGNRASAGSSQLSHKRARVWITSRWPVPVLERGVVAPVSAGEEDGSWEAFISWDNLWHAYRAAARGKRAAEAVARWEFRLGDRLLRLQGALQEERWQPGRYVRFEVHEPKHRVISAAPFGDRVVHHALMQVTAHRFEKDFSPNSHANRLGYGTHRAIREVAARCARHRWALRLDVQKHFESIDHELLLQVLDARIRDERLRRVVRAILATGETDTPLPALWLPGDDLLSACRPRGLPIGNLTSQFWSNVYLDRLDQFVQRQLRCADYTRYVDDMVLFADDTRQSLAWREAIVDFCAKRLRLKLHAHSAHPMPTRQGVPWLGMVVFPDRVRLKSRKVVTATRRLRRAWEDWQAGAIPFQDFDSRVQGWIAHVAQADSWRLRESVLHRFPLTRPVATPDSTAGRQGGPGAVARP